ncbi:MAG TPA: SDR family oxidoreductase [Candidatus Nanopelagicaceae bacterium]|nr:SDR family oxidoreductase [Candidatus Nanopelagicaceae bacterium]
MGNPSRNVLVTGATSGIGLSVTKELAATGFDLIATARTADKAEALGTLLAQLGLKARVLICDFEKADQLARLVDQVFEIWPSGPWALINNAGFGAPGAVEDVSTELAQRQLITNVLAPAQLIRAFVPSMRAQGTGRIVNISSIQGRISSPFMGWYSASKYALEALSDALRGEVREFGIEVILVEPSGFASSIWSNALPLLPENAHTGPYRKAYSGAEKLIGSKFPEPTPVAKIVRTALETTSPKARYLVGKGTRAIPFLRVLPERMLDQVMLINLGLMKAPLVLGIILSRTKRLRKSFRKR